MASGCRLGKGTDVRHFVMAFLALLALAAPGPAAAQGQREIRIVALGDSLTAGYQLPPGDAFPVKLQAALRARGHAVTVDNAGVSGDTSTGGLERLDWAVGEGVDAVILELGANDALRGLDPEVTRRSLDEILVRLKAKGIPVLVAGMLAPPNLGHAYGEAFGRIFPELAARHGALLYPFFLDGVAATQGLNLADGMHPNAKGVDIIVERILPKVEELIAVARARPRG
jgi:acyl-CoA thioesterase-1